LALGAREKAVLRKLGTTHLKIFFISLFPNIQGSNGENFLKKIDMTILLCLSDGVKELEIVITVHAHIIPTLITEGHWKMRWYDSSSTLRLQII
jgi:hypothetical protein